MPSAFKHVDGMWVFAMANKVHYVIVAGAFMREGDLDFAVGV